MGLVYLGHQFGAPVAVKVALPHLRTDKMTKDQMRSEALALSRIDHPNVVRLVAAGTAAQGPFVATTWVNGCRLLDLLREGSPDRRLSLSLFRQLLDAVEACHANGVVHADIKSENVMVSCVGSRQSITLIDFGVACVDGRKSGDPDSVYGTVGFLAPELWEGGPPTPVSDVFALGAILRELLIGRRLATGSVRSVLPTKRIRRIRRIDDSRSARRTFNENTAAIEAIVARAMAPAPRGRYQTVPELRCALDERLGNTR